VQALQRQPAQPKPPEPAPPGFNADKAFAGIHWHQQWEVFQNITTPGRNPVGVLCDYVGLPHDLRGQRVLDIGAYNGCFSFECERRGAAEVVALILEDPEATGFRRLKTILNSNVQCVQESVYAIDENTLGQFDVVLFLGVLYHLRYPLLAIDKLRTVCRGTAYVETHVIDNYFMFRGRPDLKPGSLQEVHPELPRVPLWRFYKDHELLNDRSNWFGPNTTAVKEAFESAGFTVQLEKLWVDRAAFSATVTTTLANSLKRTYEGNFAKNQQFLGLTKS
jgi:tRNA (mo5U34)-methyltransferase